ncbi:MAG: T9SS type A sorting domain-containing protein, partial [Flavobacterium sp.]
ANGKWRIKNDTIYFQVRSVSDAMYNSNIVPWSNLLTGTYGQAPANAFDPLQYVIDEGHKRGMEVQAWLNPYRVATSLTQLNNHVSSHPAKQNPSWVITNGGIHYFNPGLTAVRNHIKAVVSEITSNYDIDGIHFDDYFYQANLGTQDAQTFINEPRGYSNINDWRRNNVTLLLTEINTTIKALKPWVKFGISPSGIYRNSTNPAIGTNTAGQEHYSSHYIDSKYIMEQNLIDYLTPQVYWYIGQSNANFSVIIPWWNNISTSRHITIGLAAYKVGDVDEGQFNTNVSEISQQVNLIRSTTNLKGAAYYNTTTLNANKNNFRTNLIANQYSTPAIIPSMTWLDNIAPAEPSNLTATLVSGKTNLTWTPPPSTTDELQKVVRYAVYRSNSSTIDFNLSTNLIAIIPSSVTTYTDNTVTPGLGTSYYYAIKSLDRISNESTASNVVPDAITLPVKLLNFAAKKDVNRVKIEWSTASELNSDYFLIEKAGTDGIFNYLAKQSSASQNSSTIQNYVVWDYNPLNGINYYRLTQFDKDGTASKPELTSLNFNELIIVNATAFPNPTQRDINFNLENFSGKSIKTRLINLFGQVIHEEEFDTQSGANKYQLGLKTELPKGQYILSLSDNSFKKNIKLIVL